MIYPWQESIWAQLLKDTARLPHALLLAGPAGGGKGDFAVSLARRLLCETAQGPERACGECPSCHLFEGGNHPDLRALRPQSEEDEPEDGERSKSRSTQIRIEQIRGLAEFLAVGAVRGGRRVVLIDPADAMNVNGANSLLKLLEEPPPSTQFVLISDAPRRLLPTIISRTRAVSFPRPDRASALQWLEGEGVAGAARHLDLAGGMPLAARDLASRGEWLERFVRDVASLPRADALALAGQWEAWVKPKAGGEAMGLPLLVSWMSKWVWDLIATRQAHAVRFFVSERDRLALLAERAPLAGLLSCYTALLQMKRVCEHPLNPRLFLDDMLLRYVRALG